MEDRIYDISPKSRKYKGVQFRSTLEIKWAIFFDVLNWEWKYEPEVFMLPTNNYMPDFYFPDIKVFAEVKLGELNQKERLKCTELSFKFIDQPILLLVGDPSPKPIKTICNGGNWVDVVPVPTWDKFYPLFCTEDFNDRYFNDTLEEILISLDF